MRPLAQQLRPASVLLAASLWAGLQAATGLDVASPRVSLLVLPPPPPLHTATLPRVSRRAVCSLNIPERLTQHCTMLQARLRGGQYEAVRAAGPPGECSVLGPLIYLFSLP
jgi:hypothetical protein